MHVAARALVCALLLVFCQAAAAATTTTTILGKEVSIELNSSGVPVSRTDPTGRWDTADGGVLWVKRGNTNEFWRGSVSIDKDGNFVMDNSDYGVRKVFYKDGSHLTEIKASTGVHSVLCTKSDICTRFQDTAGTWSSRDGKNWTNQSTGTRLQAKVSVTYFGEFRLDPTKGRRQVARTAHLENILEERAMLTKRYGVTFAEQGEVTHEDKHRLIAGMPTQSELNLTKLAIEKTRHEQLTNLKVWFIQPPTTLQDEGSYVSPDHTNKRDLHLLILPAVRKSTMAGLDSLEAVLLHEFAHHEQNMRWGPKDIGAPGSPQESVQLMRDLGWVYNTGRSRFELRDKLGGKWFYQESNEVWIWAGGTRPKNGVLRLEDEEMRERALVRPANNYFVDPAEMDAEGRTLFRLDRLELARRSPALYKVIRQSDQESIDRAFGKGTTVRDLDGNLVKHTPATAAAIKAAELAVGIDD